MFETLRVVNGHKIIRMIGTHGFYHVIIRESNDLKKRGQTFALFKTLKDAVAFAEQLEA